MGDFLLSHTLAHAVPSGLRGLTAVFGMGTGGTPSLRSPKPGWAAARLAGGFTCLKWVLGFGIERARMMGYANCVSEFLSELLSDLRREVMNSFIVCFHAVPHCVMRGRAMENFMVKPNGRLVTVSFTHYCASTSVLSTWSSSTALQGDLILGKVSRLYAFSAYPDRISLPSDAPGGTTGSQEIRSPRSSRTKGKPPQISYAHHR